MPHHQTWLPLVALTVSTVMLTGTAARGETVRLDVTRDTWFSAVGDEADANTGGSSRLKLKSIQEMSLLDVDPAPLRGRAVKSATLHLRVAGDERLHRVTVSSFAAEWVEGTAESYAPQAGSSTFNRRRHPDEPWAAGAGDLTAVTLGQGGTVWRMADATPPDADGWQRIPVDPAVVAARVAGASHGFLVFDDTGSEWSRNGEAFKLRLFPNRFVYSREAGKARAPYLTVELADDGDAAAKGRGKEPEDPRPVGGGDVGEQIKPAALPGKSPAMPKGEAGPLPTLGAASVAVVDALDKLMPVSGEMVPPQDAGYLGANHLWSAKDKRVRLHAARNEFAAFQVVMQGAVRDATATLRFDGEGPAPAATFHRFRYVNSPGGFVPDPLVPLDRPFSVPAEGAEAVEGQTSASLLCEVYVPHDARAGERRGTLTLSTAEGGKLELAVVLTVWDFTLPDHLSFIPEMNCYNLPAEERAYYRLAHANRTVLNRVPYYQNGRIAEGCAPGWDGAALDWRAWDARFGQYLDGSAFADLPRKGVPVECFYLPLHENWPAPIEGNYNGDYWADRAFTPAYRKAFVDVSRQMTEHFAEHRWTETLFHCFQNGKNNFKENGWSRGSSPWLLDEPANFQDYWALRYFGEAFHEGVNAALGAGAAGENRNPRMLFRADISRPQWQRDALDHVLDYNVVAGGPFLQYHPLVTRRKSALRQVVVIYGSTNDPAASNMQPVGWCLDAWSRGADGVLPWQTVGEDASWKTADPLSLFYPGKFAGLDGPTPSVRLKAYLRGQQDVEYLTLLARLQKRSPLELGPAVREALKLAGVRRGTGFAGGEDAGIIDFGDLKPQAAWALRVRVGEALSAARPAPQRRLVDFRTPRRDPAAGRGGYVSTGPIAEPERPPFTAGTP